MVDYESQKKIVDLIGKKVKLSILYRGSMHDFKSEDFHERCDGKGKTLSITKTTNGKIFGFYTPIAW